MVSLYWPFKHFCNFQGCNIILVNGGLYLQNDSYLISNSPYTINLATKLKLGYSYLICWSDMQMTLFANELICIFINIDENF